MKNVLALALGTAGLFASSLSAPFPPTPSGTVWCFIARIGPPIVASTPGTPVTGLQLAVDVTPATLETTGFTGGYTLTNGGIGAFEGCHNWWLNIGTSAKSYKPLSWAFDDQVTTNWAVTAGSPISATATASYNATSKFLACTEAGKWRVYLQTGKDKPAGLNCTTTELVLQTS